MACSPLPHLRFFPWTSPKKPLYPVFTNSLFLESKKLSLYVSRIPTCVSTSDEEAKNKTASTLRELCQSYVPDHVLRRAEELGYVVPTEAQRQALPVLFSGCDCVLHAQTGSGKTLAYLLLIFSVVNAQRSAVQALIVLPTRELGMQVAKVARMLAARSSELESGQNSCTVMALLDGGTLRRHKSWLKVEPPAIVIATLGSLCQMLDKQILRLDAMRVLVIDEVDFLFNSSKEVSYLRRLLTTYSSINNRQTIFASASIPQHRRFLYDCIQQKWTKANVSHVHINPVEPMPSCLHHRFLSEKSKKSGDSPPTTLLVEFLRTSHRECPEIVMLEAEMNFNQRAASIIEVKQAGGYLLVATDIAARGVDLPETTHIYNFNLPKDATSYLHRAGRTGRKPFSDSKCYVTSILTSEERFVLQRFENELFFQCEELFI
ncbi:DEAD-box ATP-dependent RNA helicase 58, chloroplastic isoform X2 [Primulina eburnea]|uniref:DEAD-box ATP-dependent RNA helicase 58, chloroplastic isoform X2 n=1 Tax=Primulina eburnea TaxID=1245227 RepID=UPI003C6BEA99